MVLAGLLICHPATAEEAVPVLPDDDAVAELTEELEETVAIGSETDEEIAIDSDSSIDLQDEMTERGWSISSDLRGLGDARRIEERDGTTVEESEVRRCASSTSCSEASF